MTDETRNHLYRVALGAAVRGNEEGLETVLETLGLPELSRFLNTLDVLKDKTEARRTVLLRAAR